MIVRTLDQVRRASLVDQVIVATDHEGVADAVRIAGGTAVMTDPAHESGSDRIAEVARGFAAGTIVVNVQGDEPMIPPSTIDAAIDAMLASPDADIVTTWEVIACAADVLSPDVVKVVSGRDGNALYFSRSPIPFPRDQVRRHGSLAQALENEPELSGEFRKHTGLYVYRRDALLRFTALGPTPFERLEMLEQLRALENGFRIKTVEVHESSVGVDTESDLERVRRYFS